MRKGIAVAGNLIVDYVKLVDSFPKQGNLSNIYSISRSVGGAMPNVLIDLSRIDNTLSLEAIGLAGHDDNGEYVINMLGNNGVDTSNIIKDDKLATSFTDVVTVESNGVRTFFHYRGANTNLSFEHFNFNKLNANILHVGYALLLDSMDALDDEYGTVMAKTLAEAQKHGIKTSLDVVSENSDRFQKIVPPSLRYINYCIINEVEASLITGIKAREEDDNLLIKNIQIICHKLFDMGVKDLVVIHSPEGGFGMEKNGEFNIQPSLQLPSGYIKGSVGAGDAFCSGVLYSIYKNWDVKKAMQIAVAAAACNLSSVNSIDGMKDIHLIEKLYNKMPKKKLVY